MTIKLAYKLREASAATGFTEKQLRQRINAGELKAKRAARDPENPNDGRGEFVILHADLERFLSQLADA